MVVLRPLLEGERTRSCECGHTGITSPFTERSSFYPKDSKKRTASFRRRCRSCDKACNPHTYPSETAEARRAQYARRKASMTPEGREVQRARWRENRRRLVAKKEVAERYRVQSRENQKRRMERLGDEYRELRRIDAAIRKERRGEKPLKTLQEVRSLTGTSREKLPVAPFRKWLQFLVEKSMARGHTEDAAKGRVSDALGCSSRRLYSWLKEYGFVDYCTVDRAASRHGTTTVEEIYNVFGNGTYFQTTSDGKFLFVVNQWAPDAEGVELVSVKAKVRSCRSPGCEEDAEEGSRFCSEHAAFFAKVKDDLASEAQAFRSRIKRKGMRSTCCRPGCTEPRLQKERYCDTCYDAGWREEEIE